MDVLKEVLGEVKNGKKSFKPTGSSKEQMEDFQSVAKLLIYANEQKFLGSFLLHKESRSGNMWYDLIQANGLSHKGDLFLLSNATESCDPLINEIVQLKPNFYGLGIDLNAVIRWWKARTKE